MNALARLALAWRILRARPSNLMAHAISELGPNLDTELKELILVFGTQGHSGGSAEITTHLLSRLLRYEPLGPLTGEDSEWVDVGQFAHGGTTVFQNRRCSRVFKQADRFDGQAYDVNGIVWRDPEGGSYTNVDSMVPIVFPYTPHTEYRDAPRDEAVTG